MGVALMTSTSTDSAPRRWSAARWSTPKRCCSSTMASPRRAKATPSWMSAWVPTASGMVPSASPASALLRAFPLTAPVSSTGSTPRGAASGPTECQPELEEEELVEDERAVGERAHLAERLEVGLGRGRVHVAERAGEVDHTLARRDCGRQRARHALGELLDRGLRDAPHRPRVHRGRLLVDGHDARQRGRVLVGAEDLHLGVDDTPRPAAERRLDPAVHDEALPLAQAAAEVRDLVEPDEEEEPVAVAQHDLEGASAAAGRPGLGGPGDLAHRRRLLADVELAERLERAPVLVAERQVIEEVLDGREAEARQP